jgi:hypothetical protein
MRSVLAAFTALCLSMAPVSAQTEPPPLPSQEEARAFLKTLLAANSGELKLGTLQIHVSFVPNYAEYAVARDYAAEDFEDSDDRRRWLKRRGKKYGKWKGKWGALLHCRQPSHSLQSDFYVGEKPLAKKLVFKAEGRGKVKFKVAWENKHPTPLRLKIFGANKTAQGAVTVDTVQYVLVSPGYRVDAVLRKPLKETVRRLTLSVGKLIRFHGSGIAKAQVDLGGGAKRDVIASPKVYADVAAGIPLAKGLPGLAAAAGFAGSE